MEGNLLNSGWLVNMSRRSQPKWSSGERDYNVIQNQGNAKIQINMAY